MATRRDIITRAFRRIHVVAQDEAPEGTDYANGLDTLTDLFADLNGPWGGCALAFTIDDTIPAAYVFPLVSLLAVRLAVDYQRQAPEPEKTALMRVRAVNLPYTRDMDLDEDGTTTDEEIDAFDESAYY